MILKLKRKNLLLGLILLVIPTLGITYPFLEYISDYYSLLFIEPDRLLRIFGIAMVGAYILHGTRLRFFIVFGLLLIVLYYIYQRIAFTPFDEFDSYYIANRFRINATVFALGWFSGFGLARWRYFVVFYALIVLALSCIALAAVGIYDANRLAWLIAPPVFYTFYALFIKELLNNIRNQGRIHYGRLLVRVGVFCSVLLLLFWATTQLLQSKFSELDQALQAQQEADGKGEGENKDEDSMMDRDGQNRFQLKDYTELRPRLRQSEELLFTAYIDNFFEGGDPNPQYITLYHLNQYNPDLERFEIDPEGPADDLFIPDPTQIPNYYVQENTDVLENDRMETYINPIQSTIYVNQLDPSVFVAPSTAYSCQPITVEPAFRDQYRFAYNVRSEVSALNSAYFVYNTNEPQIKKFQDERFRILSGVKDYDGVPEDYLSYYTKMPSGPLYDRVGDLAADITKDAKSPIDKVNAVRDYFLSKDKNGEPLFVYTLTPGSPTDPNIPDASLLNNFLFNTKKGYCTYFAASTLFMLRSMGIPTRMAVGFMTINRSHNNPGWYWFYADQAHAWTQVYFPEYGWLDFDMTISNSDAEQTNQPDRTPPLPPVEPQFVAKGLIQQLDTVNKTLVLDADLLVVKKSSIALDEPQTFALDARTAKVLAEYDTLSFTDLKVGDTAIAISFDLRIQDMSAQGRRETDEAFIDRLPDTVQVQEILIKPEEEEDPLEDEETNFQETLNRGVNFTLILFGVLIALLFSAPSIHYLLLRSRFVNGKHAGDRVIALYPLVHFLLNQMGHGRGTKTPLEYARQTVDPLLGSRFADVLTIYLKIKYSKEPLTASDEAVVEEFYPAFKEQFRSTFPIGKRIWNFLKVNRWFYYLINLNIS